MRALLTELNALLTEDPIPSGPLRTLAREYQARLAAGDHVGAKQALAAASAHARSTYGDNINPNAAPHRDDVIGNIAYHAATPGGNWLALGQNLQRLAADPMSDPAHMQQFRSAYFGTPPVSQTAATRVVPASSWQSGPMASPSQVSIPSAAPSPTQPPAQAPQAPLGLHPQTQPAPPPGVRSAPVAPTAATPPSRPGILARLGQAAMHGLGQAALAKGYGQGKVGWAALGHTLGRLAGRDQAPQAAEPPEPDSGRQAIMPPSPQSFARTEPLLATPRPIQRVHTMAGDLAPRGALTGPMPHTTPQPSAGGTGLRVHTGEPHSGADAPEFHNQMALSLSQQHHDAAARGDTAAADRFKTLAQRHFDRSRGRAPTGPLGQAPQPTATPQGPTGVARPTQAKDTSAVPRTPAQAAPRPSGVRRVRQKVHHVGATSQMPSHPAPKPSSSGEQQARRAMVANRGYFGSQLAELAELLGGTP